MSRCPGCGLGLPDAAAPPARTGSLRASPECRALYGEVVGYAVTDPVRLAPWHQTCVDAYGAQHVGLESKPIGVAFVLNGLYLVFERGFTGIQVREAHGYLAGTVESWPRFDPPASVGEVTVFDVAMAGSVDEHIAEMTDRQLRDWWPRPARD